MHKPRWRYAKPLLVAGALGACVTVALFASSAGARPQASIQACALLPDTKSSTRYTLFDAPYLTAAFKKAGVSAHVLNALGDPQTQKSQAEQCLAKGAKVILLDQLDPASGAAITNVAVAQGAKVDRLRPPRRWAARRRTTCRSTTSTVGKLQGKGLVAALKAKGMYSKHPVIAELNGGITDNNAKLFKQGYDSVLNPLYEERHVQEGERRATSGPTGTRSRADDLRADARRATATRSTASIAANDGLAGAVIASLKAPGLKPIPLTGQDATPTGVQYILAGWQSGTVYKTVKQGGRTPRPAPRSTIVKGQKVPGVNGKVSGTPSILLTPIWITKANYKTPLHGRLPEEEPGLHRAVQEVLQVDRPDRWWRRPLGAPRSTVDNPTARERRRPLRHSSCAGSRSPSARCRRCSDVDFEVRDGEVMALVGDNGAGKSTLIKCVAGHPPDRLGRDPLRRQAVTIHGPKDAAKLGIEVVYQDLALCDNLDVVQNMFLGREEHDLLYRLKEPRDGAARRPRR